jgi:hypothetical protein
MAFYAEHFMVTRDRLIIRPHYTLRHWIHTLQIPLGQFKVSSHRLQTKIDHQIEQSNGICQLCHLREIETKEHFIFRCPIYYEIQGWFHCLFRELQTLGSFFLYPNQRCLTLYIHAGDLPSLLFYPSATSTS